MSISENAKRFLKFNALSKRTVELITRAARGKVDGDAIDTALNHWELALNDVENAEGTKD